MHAASVITPQPLRQQRLDAFKRGELIGRPMVSVTWSPAGVRRSFDQGFYHDKLYGDPESIIRLQMESERSVWRAGETVPGRVSLSLGPDECAAFCGAAIAWSVDHPGTNWSVPCVDDWRSFLPLAIREDSHYWRKSVELYQVAAALVPPDWSLQMPDLHSNIDLLAALRDPIKLCMDLVDMPEVMDEAFSQTVDVVRTIHDRLSRAAGRPGLSATLQSDFCCLVGPEMFRRWIVPTLEAEALIVGDSVFHWDGPDAVKHLADICAIRGIYAVAYVPGAGRGSHIDYVDLYREVQAHRMGVVVHGTVDEVKWMHGQLDPRRTIYHCAVSSPAEGLAVLDWFERRT